MIDKQAEFYAESFEEGRKEREAEIINKAKKMIKEIECFNEANHLVGVNDILKGNGIQDNEKTIKIVYESELFILNKLIRQIKDAKEVKNDKI